jgi:tRNA A-37 threonylcarbamoyl transferase component Bud32
MSEPTAVSGSPVLFDEVLMQRTFEEHLLPFYGESAVIRKCRRRWAKARPLKGTFQAVYQVDVTDAGGSAPASQKLFLMIPGESRLSPEMPAVGQPGEEEPLGDTGLRLSYLYLPQMQLLIQVFPTDLRMPQLRTLVDPAAVAPYLQAHAGLNGAGAPAVRVLKYKPDKRCVIRYDFSRNGHRLAADRPPSSDYSVIGKTFHNSKGKDVFRHMQLLRRSGVPVPEPLAYIPELKLVLTEALHGRELGAFVDEPDFLAHVRQAARAVAGLHSIPVDLEIVKTVTLAERAAKFGRLAARFQKTCPSRSGQIEAIASTIRRQIETRCDDRLTFVHGELDHRQLIVCDGKMWFVDFDVFKASHPAMDVGRFLAHLSRLSLKIYDDPSRLSAAGEAFLEEYLCCYPDDIRREIKIGQAIELVRIGGRKHRRQKSEWESDLARILDVTEKVLSTL